MECELEKGKFPRCNIILTLRVPTIDGVGPVDGYHHSAEEEYLKIPGLYQNVDLVARFLNHFGSFKG